MSRMYPKIKVLCEKTEEGDMIWDINTASDFLQILRFIEDNYCEDDPIQLFIKDMTQEEYDEAMKIGEEMA